MNICATFSISYVATLLYSTGCRTATYGHSDYPTIYIGFFTAQSHKYPLRDLLRLLVVGVEDCGATVPNLPAPNLAVPNYSTAYVLRWTPLGYVWAGKGVDGGTHERSRGRGTRHPDVQLFRVALLLQRSSEWLTRCSDSSRTRYRYPSGT